MKSPKDMRIIQIDVTNACIHNCSNCTRFCGHHQRPFFMEPETFERAVDSLDGYVGTVSMMGGEPTLHPEFERLLRYLASKYPVKKDNPLKYPQKSFLDAIHEVEMEHVFLHPCEADPTGTRQTIHGPGLWSAMGERYKKFYELIQDTVCYQALNDHSHPMYHQPALISRKSLGIPDEEWTKLRDNCWIQNLWSACITPKGAFFCEVAGALDMLFDGPGGWPIEPGWWKRTPDEFGGQLHWCELCGLALTTFTRNANEEVDDVSPDLYERLKKAGSRKVGTDHINVVQIEDGRITEESKAAGKRFAGSMPYTESYAAKLDKAAQDLAYKRIIALLPDRTMEEAESLRNGQEWLSGAVAGLDKDNRQSLGQLLYRGLFGADHNTWALVLIGEVTLKDLGKRLQELILNPGTLLYREEADACEDDYFYFTGKGGVMLINASASSIKKAGWDRLLKVEYAEELKNLWQPDKVVGFKPDAEYDTIRAEILPDQRYAVYGAGETAPAVLGQIRESGALCVGLIDGNQAKWGSRIEGVEVYSPTYLKEHRDAFDKVIIASTRYYCEIRDSLFAMGFTAKELGWWV